MVFGVSISMSSKVAHCYTTTLCWTECEEVVIYSDLQFTNQIEYSCQIHTVYCTAKCAAL